MRDDDTPQTPEHLYAPATRIIHGPFQTPFWDYSDHIVPPMSTSTAYRLQSVARGAQGFAGFASPDIDRRTAEPIFIYDRLDEPTRAMLEERLASFEGGDVGVCFTSGMAAISAAICVLAKAGEGVVAHRTMYGCSYSLMANWLPRQNIDVQLINLNDADALRGAISPATRVVYCESPANPTLELIDLARVRQIVDQANAGRPDDERIQIVVDNTFATTYCQRPLTLGADLSVMSLTKDISGFGTVMGGAVIAPRELEPALMLYRKDFGGALPSHPAWSILTYGLSTLPLRVERQQQNAIEVARFLEAHPMVARVSYPGLESFPQAELARRQMVDPEGRFAPGVMVYLVLAGEPEQARLRGAQLMDALARDALSITLAVSLGQLRTLIEHPSSMTHAMIPVDAQLAAGMETGGVRMAMGIESSADLIHDLERAFEQLD